MAFITDLTSKFLNLSGRNLNDDDIKALVIEISTNNTLTTLYLYNNNIGDEGAKALATLQVADIQRGSGAPLNILARNTTLTTLDLGINNIGDEGAKALAANTTLTTLYLNYNHIGPEGANTLARNTTLTALDLRYNNIGAEGAKNLAMNTTLTTLDLGGNNIGSEGVKALATNTTLTAIHLWGNNIRDEMMKIAEQRLEDNRRLQRARRDKVTALLYLIKKEGKWRGWGERSERPRSEFSLWSWNASLSFWYQLPKDIRSVILPFLFKEWSKRSINKTRRDIEMKYKEMRI